MIADGGEVSKISTFLWTSTMNDSLRDRIHVYKTHIRQSSYNSLIVQNNLKLVEMGILKYFHSLN